MKKIVFTIDTMTAGGAERVTASLANSLIDYGYDVTIINSDSESVFYRMRPEVNIVKMGINYEKQSSINKLGRMYKKYKFLCNYFREEKPDVVVAFLINMEIPSLCAALRTHTKVYTSVRNSLKNYSKPVMLIRKLLYPHIDGVIFQSEKVMNDNAFKNLTDKNVIPNPLPESINHKQTPVNYRDRKKWIISVGRLTPQKNHNILIHAFKKINAIYKDVELHIFGEGELKNTLEDTINSLGLADKVFLDGIQENAVERNRDALLFVLSSDYEGMPNVLIEAMAYGVPVVSTDFDTGVARELIQEKENGCLVEVGNVDELYKKMLYILDLKQDSDILAEKGTEIYNKLNITYITERWISELGI